MKLNKIQMTLIHRYQNAQLILSDKNDAIQFVTSNCASASFNLGKKKEKKKKDQGSSSLSQGYDEPPCGISRANERPVQPSYLNDRVDLPLRNMR